MNFRDMKQARADARRFLIRQFRPIGQKWQKIFTMNFFRAENFLRRAYESMAQILFTRIAPSLFCLRHGGLPPPRGLTSPTTLYEISRAFFLAAFFAVHFLAGKQRAATQADDGLQVA